MALGEVIAVVPDFSRIVSLLGRGNTPAAVRH
jgi:hypothetical protein